MIIGPPETLYEGGFFAAKLVFPTDFPNQPPVMTFKTPLWHPNGMDIHVYVCMYDCICIILRMYIVVLNLLFSFY